MNGPALKKLAWLNGAVPVVLLAWDAYHDRLGANPVNFAIRTTGILSLIFLVLMLAVSPVIAWTKQSGLAGLRRVFGLYAFYHAAIHFGIFFGYDRAANLADTFSEIGKRFYLLVGFISLVIMLPLAVTSTNGMIRRMGGKRWKLLHRLAYLAAIGGVLHFFLLVKADTTRPIVYAALIGGFLVWRAGHHYFDLRKRASMAATPSPANTSKKFWTGPMRLAAIFSETPDVKTFRFVPEAGGPLPFTPQAGQYLTLTVMIDGRPVRRSYTISSSPTNNHACEISVKRESAGLMSRFLHDHAMPGMIVTVAAPAGKFTFTGREANRLILIGGGVGITPLMAKIRYLTDIAWPGEINLLHSIRSPGEWVFREEMIRLAARYVNVKVTVTVTRDAPPDWTGERGRIDEAMLRRTTGDLSNARVHLCGPTEMTTPLIELVKRLGVPEAMVHHEAFTSPSRVTSESPQSPNALPAAAAGSITFRRTGKKVDHDGNRVILEIAEENGIDLPYDCRSGVCGQCKVKMISGDVAMDTEDALSAGERSTGIILACQARCQNDVTIDA